MTNTKLNENLNLKPKPLKAGKTNRIKLKKIDVDITQVQSPQRDNILAKEYCICE